MNNPTRRQTIQSMMAGSMFMPAIVSDLLASESRPRTTDPLAPKAPHFPAKAKSVIFVFATGGVSHIETFDPKPMPASVKKGVDKDKLMGNIFGSGRNSRTGAEVSNIFPHMRGVMDEVCLIRTMYASHFDHSEATLGMHSGSPTFKRPSMGSWVSYGLGSENQDLPGFIVIAPKLPYGGTQVYANDFLPAFYQGTRVFPGKKPIADLVWPGKNRSLQAKELELVQRMNQAHANQRSPDPALAARMKSFETAFRMQTAAPEAFDVESEPKHIQEMYGLNRKGLKGPNKDFSWQCLVARRLVQRGVRFVELIDSGSGGNWDSHTEMKDHANLARNADQPLAALIRDLKQQGMLDETIVVFATEFGRTPTKEGKNGRGHHRECFSMWLAGGGFKAGHVHGVTDDIGKYPVEGRVEVHDLHATILHQLGMDHERLTFRHAGRDFRLTDVHGRIVNEILA